MDSAKHVLFVLSSPRKNGNSTFLAKEVAKGVIDGGGTVDFITLADLDIHPCLACNQCLNPATPSPATPPASDPAQGSADSQQTPPSTSVMDNRCVQKDDMAGLYAKVRESSAMVLASPVYWFNLSGQLKVFIDRLYAMQENNTYAFTGKKIGLVLTYADNDIFASGGVNAARCIQDICTFSRATFLGLFHASADKPGDVTNDKGLIKRAHDYGISIANALD